MNAVSQVLNWSQVGLHVFVQVSGPPGLSFLPPQSCLTALPPPGSLPSSTWLLGTYLPRPPYTLSQPRLSGPPDLFSTLRIFPLMTRSFHLGFLARATHRYGHSAFRTGRSTSRGSLPIC